MPSQPRENLLDEESESCIIKLDGRPCCNSLFWTSIELGGLEPPISTPRRPAKECGVARCHCATAPTLLSNEASWISSQTRPLLCKAHWPLPTVVGRFIFRFGDIPKFADQHGVRKVLSVQAELAALQSLVLGDAFDQPLAEAATGDEKGAL